ncbi:cytochrome P450 [Devosia sp. RR2S18]|uniref:cytochrome P450 n=1 Tax=Devosia rhizosphaerae TaxID=3049774 RepID=UPI0025421081|nr:cytochrome P450 [Devosia sp. RR2S18]WIJ25449.1 cytochrome P450 [Devosia sp. RR2S18]
MAHDPAPVPKASGFDNTVSLLREGYDFIGNRCQHLGSDGFETRLMLRPVLCLRGAKAAQLFYGKGLFTRKGAMPPTTLRLLQDKGSVQSLDGVAHRHRKALFTALLMDSAPDRMVQLFERHWREALTGWERQGEMELFSASNLVLTRAAWEWAGLPLSELDDEDMCGRLVGMVENAGKVGPRMWRELARRSGTERQLERCIERIRNGTLDLPYDAPAVAIATHRDRDGKFLPKTIASVELINLLRPIVAIGRWVLYCGMALNEHRQWADRFAAGDDAMMEPFAEEVRRIYPFFPVIGGVAKVPFTWCGKSYPTGQWVLLDLFSTNRDPLLYPDPESLRPERAHSWRDQDFRFMPQGAGDAHVDHRCPGERLTVGMMTSAIRLLTREMRYEVPEQDLALPRDRLPTRPKQGFRMRNVRRATEG